MTNSLQAQLPRCFFKDPSSTTPEKATEFRRLPMLSMAAATSHLYFLITADRLPVPLRTNLRTGRISTPAKPGASAGYRGQTSGRVTLIVTLPHEFVLKTRKFGLHDP